MRTFTRHRDIVLHKLIAPFLNEYMYVQFQFLRLAFYFDIVSSHRTFVYPSLA